MVEFKQRSIGQTGKRKVPDEDDPEEEQMEENHPTPSCTSWKFRLILASTSDFIN